jgi:CheY-like chemotaxis protein
LTPWPKSTITSPADFCDILMPKLDGYQTCAIIKRNARFSDTPVVMLSSKDGVFDKARGRMVGCQEYLTKPFTKDQLLQPWRNMAATHEALVPIANVLIVDDSKPS